MRWHLFLVGLLAASALSSTLACATDEVPGTSSDDDSSEASSGEPEPGTSEVGTDTSSTEDSGDESETGEPEPEPLSCGELIDCLTGCIMDLGLDCLAECGTNADPGQLDEAGALLACIGGVCVDKGQCDFADSFDQASCLACIGLGLFLPEPPGCEAEAAICDGEEPPPGDGDGDATTGDGDGDATTGDGDGDATTGDGDGDATTGDGDATTGDGDGDATTGDGDGEP